MPLRIAIDTNCLIAALTSRRGSCAALVRAWREGRVEVVASDATIHEAENVIRSGWLGRVVGSDRVDDLLTALRERAVRVESPPRIHDLLLKDEGDLRMVEAAVAGEASVIATTDREFLSQRGYGLCEFVTPEEALRRLDPESGRAGS